MSGKNTTVSLTLQIKGNAGQEMKKISDQQIQATTKINQQWTQIGSANAKFVQTAKAGTQATVNTARAGENLLRTNRMLEGVLRQQSIQTELQSQQLKQQQSSAQQMANWMKQVAQSSRQTKQEAQQTVSFWQKGVALGGAAVAGGAVISSALQKPRDYEKQLTYITATATGGQGLSTAERLKSRETLNSYIKTAVRNGGGTREDAAEAANALIASGKYDLNTVGPALEAAVKTAFSADADAKDAATLTVRMQDFGLTDLQKGHDIAVRGAQLGSFEYKDQAKWLAQQMAAAKAAGYSGEKGFVELVAMNQVAMSTAATTDEGGNNLVNLLGKLSSTDFSTAVAKAVDNTDGLPTKAIKNKKGKVVGQEFDWTTYSMAEREKGVYGVDAFVKLLERQLQGNSQYQDLQKKIANTTDNEQRKSILEDMSNIASGSQLGEFLADRQALMAALAVYYKKDDLSKMKEILPNAGGTVASEYDLISQGGFAKKIAMDQEKLFAQSKAYDAVSGPLSTFQEKITDVARENETLAASAYGATVALTALAAGAGVATVLGGKGAAGKAVGGIASAARTGGGLVMAGAAKFAGPAAAVAGAGAVGYGVGTVISKNFVEGTSFGDKLGETIAKTLAVFGNEDAKAALEAQAKYDQMIAEQARNNQISAELSSKIGTLIDVTRQNKPIPFQLGGGSLAESFGRPSQTSQENRHGAAKPFMLMHTGR